jgi:hypothetical protein
MLRASEPQQTSPLPVPLSHTSVSNGGHPPSLPGDVSKPLTGLWNGEFRGRGTYLRPVSQGGRRHPRPCPSVGGQRGRLSVRLD